MLIAFAGMHALGIGSNIMSLGGIAIALGAMVDAAIVMIENAHKHVERLKPGEPRAPALIAAAKEVGPALFFSLLVIIVSFLPVFALEDQEGRLFKPLAYTKTFAMAGGALLSVTLVPVLMLFFIRGRIVPEGRNPINRALIWLYRPVIRLVLRVPVLVVVAAVAVLAVTAKPAAELGSEFMPTLNEGTLLFMPVTLPGLSVTKAAELLQTQDRIIKSFPEVAIRVRQGGARDDGDRSGAGRDERDRRQPEAGERMACRDDGRQAHRRHERGLAASRRQQRLDDADQGAHRHALDRHPHPGRGQGVRPGSARARTPRDRGRAGRARRARHHQRLRRTPGGWALCRDRT